MTINQRDYPTIAVKQESLCSKISAGATIAPWRFEASLEIVTSSEIGHPNSHQIWL